jgi:hypothetical protein
VHYIIIESRKSLKNRDEVDIFKFPRFCYGTLLTVYPTRFFAQSLIRKKNGFEVIFLTGMF